MSEYYYNLFAELPPTATIITPNQRLAAYLRQLYADTKQNTVFNSLDILPIEAWLYRWYETALLHNWTDSICLNDAEALLLWEKIIIDSTTVNHLLSKPKAIAKLAYSAWELLQNWQISSHQLHHQHHIESEQFLAWLTPWQQVLKKNHWITRCELAHHLTGCIPVSYYATTNTLYLVGFDDIIPTLASFLNTLEQNKVKVVIPAERSAQNPTYKMNCKNSLEEFSLALTFAKQTLLNDPKAHIGIVIPDLHHQRSTLLSLCQKIFNEKEFFNEPEKNKWVSMSGGMPLTDSLLVQTIFSLLKLKREHIAVTDLYWLWHSPYLNFFKQDKTRPLIEQRLYHQYSKYISHATLMTVIKQQFHLQEENELPSFYRALKNPPSHNSTRQTHRTWTQWIHRYLLALGFPGHRHLISSEAQRLHAWEEVLHTFSALDRIEDAISFDEALDQLQALCQQKLFQAKGQKTPIHILGLLEASGQDYTHLWICGLNEGVLPQQPRPHPLLPVSLQKKLAMPHADSLRELQFSKKILNRLLSHSSFSICSYNEEENDMNLRLSPLIHSFADVDKATLPALPSQTTPAQFSIEKILDHYGLPLDTNTPVRGGSYLFKLQAQCPFKAYASLRLKAEEADLPGLGLSPASRGTLVHQALHHFYQVISSQSQLLSLTKIEQITHLETACQKALHFLHQNYPIEENKQHYELELARLQKLLSLWLEQEKMRPHFTVIATEKRLEATFANLTLQVQIDRIDKLDDGSEVIIDYKTGLVHIEDWFSTRPNEPQLPLYCSLYDGDIKAMAFARVNLQKINIEGIGQLSQEWESIKRLSLSIDTKEDPWQQQKIVWQQQLTALAEEFKLGFAAVMPKEGEETCRYCHLPPLCRIHQTLQEL
jgi:ATP-dependent helicase/nuclease subunit B